MGLILKAVLGCLAVALLTSAVVAVQEEYTVGPYAIRFDLGPFNHTSAPANTYTFDSHFHKKAVTSMRIQVKCPGKKDTNISISIKSNYNGGARFPICPLWSWVAKNESDASPITIDGIDGVISKESLNSSLEDGYTGLVFATYRLNDRNNGATGDVVIGAFLRDNTTLPSVTNLIKTIHVTEAIVTGYTKEIAMGSNQELGYDTVPVYGER